MQDGKAAGQQQALQRVLAQGHSARRGPQVLQRLRGKVALCVVFKQRGSSWVPNAPVGGESALMALPSCQHLQWSQCIPKTF